MKDNHDTANSSQGKSARESLLKEFVKITDARRHIQHLNLIFVILYEAMHNTGEKWVCSESFEICWFKQCAWV